MTTPDLKAMLQRQRDAFNAAPPPDARARRASLRALQRLVNDNREALAQAISQDFGNRSPFETEMLEVMPTLNAIRYARARVKEWMRPEPRPVELLFQPARAWVQHQPLGVVGIIAPWNYPLLLTLSPLCDALAAGDRVMLKPSELTPAFSALIQRLLGETFEPEQVSVVTGGPDVASAFSSLPFDHLVFTGSTAIGRKVMRAAAENLTPVTLELGGKSPLIVCPHYSLTDAARTIVFGKFVNAGQTCIAPDYVLAPADKVAALADAVMAEARASYPAIADNPDYSSIISPREYDRLTAAVAEARAAGARVMAHEDEGAAAARKIGPTLVIDPPLDGALMRDEIFGPVLPIIGYRTLDEAIAFVGRRERPLALYCLSHDGRERRKVLERTISGGVTLNGTLLHIAQDGLPFGGVGNSGFGAYHGHDGFKRLSHARAVHQIGLVNATQMFRPPFGWLKRLGVYLLSRRP